MVISRNLSRNGKLQKTAEVVFFIEQFANLEILQRAPPSVSYLATKPNLTLVQPKRPNIAWFQNYRPAMLDTTAPI